MDSIANTRSAAACLRPACLALLAFTLFACSSESDGLVIDGGPDAEGQQDANPGSHDTTVAPPDGSSNVPDGAATDSQPALDGGPTSDGADPDVAPADSAVVADAAPADMAEPPPDMAEPVDAAQPADTAPPDIDMAEPVDTAPPDIDMAEPADMAPPTPDAMPDTEPDGPWYQIDETNRTVSTRLISYEWKKGYLHDGEGEGMRKFVNKATGEDHSAGFDGLWDGMKSEWNATPAVFTTVVPMGDRVDIFVTTGLSKKIDRLYKGFPGVEIQYLENTSMWTEDFVVAEGEWHEMAFVMYGMKDIVSKPEGLKVQYAGEELAEMKFGMKDNRGDTYIEANGSTPAMCTYKGHYIYGFINTRTGRGMGFVYPTSFTIPDFRIWWTQDNKIEIEFAPGGKTGKRWLFAVTGGKEEIVRIGMSLVDNDGWKPN